LRRAASARRAAQHGRPSWKNKRLARPAEGLRP
jgi:hypothetical protein